MNWFLVTCIGVALGYNILATSEPDKYHSSRADPVVQGTSWTSWVERLELYFEGNDIVDAKRKRALLFRQTGSMYATSPGRERFSEPAVNSLNPHE